MKRQLLILPLVILASMSMAQSAPTVKVTVPKAIKARYSSMEAVMRKLDFTTFQTYFAPDFSITDPEGKISNRDQFFGMVKPMFDNATKATAVVKFTDSKSHDGLVDVSFDFSLKLMGKGGTTAIHEVGTDTWKQIGTTWVMVKTVDTKFDVTMPKAKTRKGKG